MDYKKIIKSKNIRFFILRCLSFIPDKAMLKIQYRIKMGKKLDLKNPKTFTEKIQWYKLNYRNPLMIQGADKYEVRKYVESKGLKNILNELYGVYKKAEEIDFQKLPDKFVIKTTNGGGGENIIICEDKSKLDIIETKKVLNKWMKDKNKSQGREWAYDGATPKIIIEKLLEKDSNNDLIDYKFFCFSGKVEYILICKERFLSKDTQKGFFDKNLNFKDLKLEKYNFFNDKNKRQLKKPEGYSLMIEYAEILSKDFPHVRVDFYNIEGKCIFGELTFYDASGYIDYGELNYSMGEKFVLPNCKTQFQD
ncbi:MAG: ATP-grasp fold amidoligase family protein [Fusobacterium sp.]